MFHTDSRIFFKEVCKDLHNDKFNGHLFFSQKVTYYRIPMEEGPDATSRALFKMRKGYGFT